MSRYISFWAVILLICCSWDDHPDKEYRDSNFDRCEREYGTDHTEGWTPERDSSYDRSEPVENSRGTSPRDRDK